MEAKIPWLKIHDFLNSCGAVHSHKEYAVEIVKRMDGLIPFDQARVYFLSDKGEVCDEYLLGVDKRWTKSYHEYYSKVENGRYSVLGRRQQQGRNVLPKSADCFHDWTVVKQNDEFIINHLKPQGIRHSFGLGLNDLHNTLRCTCIFDRVSNAGYTARDVQIFDYVFSHLDNLHRNFYTETPLPTGNQMKTELPLSKREAEVADLLAKGLSPESIGNVLCISKSTVYKHITHIHSKMNVNSRQELLVKLLNS